MDTGDGPPSTATLMRSWEPQQAVDVRHALRLRAPVHGFCLLRPGLTLCIPPALLRHSPPSNQLPISHLIEVSVAKHHLVERAEVLDAQRPHRPALRLRHRLPQPHIDFDLTNKQLYHKGVFDFTGCSRPTSPACLLPSSPLLLPPRCLACSSCATSQRSATRCSRACSSAKTLQGLPYCPSP